MDIIEVSRMDMIYSSVRVVTISFLYVIEFPTPLPIVTGWLETGVTFTLFLKGHVIYTMLPSTILSLGSRRIRNLADSAETPLESLKTPVGVLIQHIWNLNTYSFSVLILLWGGPDREFLRSFLASSWKKAQNRIQSTTIMFQPQLNPWTALLLMAYSLTKLPWLN